MNRPRLARSLRMSSGRMSSGTRTTLLCMAGLVVAGLGLAYCVHLGADRGEESETESTSAAAMKFIAPPTSTENVPDTVGAAPVAPQESRSAPTAISRSKMLLGTVDHLTSTELGIYMSDGRTHRIELTDATHYETADQAVPAPVKVGDLVVVHVLINGERMTADLVVDGRVTASRPGN